MSETIKLHQSGDIGLTVVQKSQRTLKKKRKYKAKLRQIKKLVEQYKCISNRLTAQRAKYIDTHKSDAESDAESNEESDAGSEAEFVPSGRLDRSKQSTFSVMTGNISINTILYSWLQDFQNMGNCYKVCIKSSSSDEYTLERDTMQQCTYLVYIQNKKICAWAEVNEEDFRNAGQPTTDWSALFANKLFK